MCSLLITFDTLRLRKVALLIIWSTHIFQIDWTMELQNFETKDETKIYFTKCTPKSNQTGDLDTST